MRNISDTITRLAALKGRFATHDGASGLDHLQRLIDFGLNPGALTARYHLPVELPEAAPLVVVLHGCTQDASSYDRHSGWSQLADEAGFALLYPEQQRANNANLCFNWFQPGDIARGSGEVASIRQMIETMIMTHNLDRRRVFVTGLSAGGAMAAAMLASYPNVFAGGAIIAGLPFGSAATVPEAFDRMRGHGGPSEQALQQALRDASEHTGPWPKISIWQGSADHTVAPVNAAHIAAQWKAVHGSGKAPTETRTNGNLKTQVWSNSDGEAVIELNIVSGMGHGTPIGDGLGTPGPFMLNVGISSTRCIAKFWGIAATDRRYALQPNLSVPAKDQSPPSLQSPHPQPSEGLNQAPASSGVKKIIEDALRAAGLMR